jgi:hypothetical protein
MNKNQQNKMLAVSLLLSALVITASCIGLLTPGFYSLETPNWQAQSIGQDMVDLFLVVPCLLLTSILAYRNNRTALMIRGGVLLYLTYTFVLYCFDVHFNALFVLYCACLGLSFYALMNFLFSQLKNKYEFGFKNHYIHRTIGIYFIIIATLFCFLWLAEIIPSIIYNITPKSLIETGLLTNGVHVLDLAVLLPGIFMAGIFLLQRKPIGVILTPVILAFFILMDLTIGLLVVVMKFRGIESDLMLTVVMGILALVSLFLLIWFMKNIKKEQD